MRIAVVGAGAMGSLLAGRLAAVVGKGPTPESTIDDVVLLGRPSDHLSAIQASGLTIVEQDAARTQVRVTATDNPAMHTQRLLPN